MKKIYLIGYFKRNLGDDLFVKIVSERYPDAKILMMMGPKYANMYNGLDNVKIVKFNIFRRLLNKLMIFARKGSFEINLVKQCDFILEIGGSIFQQEKLSDSVTKRREDYLKSGVPIFVVGSNFGPVLSDSYQRDYHNYFNSIEGTVFRDSKSWERFNDLSNVELAPDTVFLLENSNKVPIKSISKTVVFSIIDVVNKINHINKDVLKLEYEKKIVELIIKMTELKYNVILFGFSIPEGDMVESKRIYEMLPNYVRPLVTIKVHSDIDKSLSIIGSANVLVSSRFHSMILGWIFNIPQLVISYGAKTTDVIEDLYPAQFYVDIENISALNSEVFLNRINTMPKDRVTLIKGQADKQFKFVDEFYGNLNEKDSN